MDWMSLINLTHIISGVFWAGGVFLISWFIDPAVKATGGEGQVFIQGLMKGTQISFYLNLSAWIAVLSGIYLFWKYSGGFDINWIISGEGLFLTTGGIIAGAALTIGMLNQVPCANRLDVIGGEIQASGGPPTTEQVEEIQSLQSRLTIGGKWEAILLVISLAGMAFGRHMF